MFRIASGALVFGLLTLAFGQEPNPTQSMLPPPPPSGTVPVFKVDVVSRSIPAINFHHRQGTTNVDLRGTALMPTAKGKVRVDSTAGATRMKADTTKMVPPETFGPEFLTYVLWAISPEGNAKNLGELVLKNGGDNSSIETTTSLQAFGLIVTAEPYWAVSQPSDVVVMENEVRNDTTGTIETIDAKYQLLRRGQYTLNVQTTALEPMISNKRVPLQLREAREALAIARAQGADHYAADTIQKGLTDLQNAEGFYIGKHNEKELETDARQATQMAEDARLISIREEAADALAAERKASADAQAAAQARAQQESERAAQAAAQARQADSERAAAVRARADAERAKAEAQQAQLMAENAKTQAQQEQLKAQQEAEAARAAAGKAEQDRQAVRAQLLDQLNKIMETRDTARGLIMNMSDVLFDFGKATLRPEAREKLAKVSGILLAYPTLRVQIEGNTDNVGSDAFNQTLSEKRAFGVRDYLVGQGVDGNKLTAVGYGKTRPIASNDTGDGRQKNRRVEMVLSGDVIGTPINQGPTTQGAPDGNPPAAQ
jgi:outer membrane protein OmpA-like peptidoglycan-associated protein